MELGKLYGELEETNDQSFMDFVKCHHQPDVIEKIELATRGQSENKEWFRMRCGRITASVAHNILRA